MDVYCAEDVNGAIGSARGLQGSIITVGKDSSFEYCGFDAYGYFTPEYIYSYTLE
jgi:hypothetical protein